jgi:branched-chain amino acid transport system ATP-binding protein
MTLLAVDGVSKKFGEVVVANDVTFQLAEGESMGIVGPNGAGKTSLFGIISGDLRPDEGTIALDGVNMLSLSPARRAHAGIGRTYQVPRPFEHMSVFENVVVAAQQGANLRSQSAYDAAYASLVTTGLAEMSDRSAGSLGLLHRKRLELARALATRPRVLLLDEIAGGLTDPEVNELTSIVAGL